MHFLYVLGLLLGASALTLCELIDFLVTLWASSWSKRRNKQQQHDKQQDIDLEKSIQHD